MKYFVLDENKNVHEAYTKEDVLALLEQAIEDGDLSHIEEDSAFVTKIKSLISGGTYHIDFCTQAKYNELKAQGQLIANCYYFITDDNSLSNLEETVEEMQGDIDDLETNLQAEATTRETAVNGILANIHSDNNQVIIGKSGYTLVLKGNAPVYQDSSNNYHNIALASKFTQIQLSTFTTFSSLVSAVEDLLTTYFCPTFVYYGSSTEYYQLHVRYNGTSLLLHYADNGTIEIRSDNFSSMLSTLAKIWFTGIAM